MQLHYRTKARQARIRFAQYVAAFAVLAIALTCLVGWLAVRFLLSRPSDEQPVDSEPDSSVATVYTAEDTAATLVIITDEGNERFVILLAAPADKALYAIPLPAATLAQGEQTLTQILRKNGPAKVTAAVASLTGLPAAHYMALSSTAAETYLSELESGLLYTLPEAVRFTDQDGATVQLKAGEHTLTAAQAAGLLRYTGWSESRRQLQTDGDILTALFNQYLLPQRHFQGDFASLSNLAQTDLRINDFNAYRDALQHLADANTDGRICTRIDVSGKTDSQGRFILQPDSAVPKR